MKHSKSLVTSFRALCLLIALALFGFQSSAAPGDVDLSFDPGSGINGEVKALALQADGKLIVGGGFTTVKGMARSGLARLNPDASGDPTFDAGTTADKYVSAIAVQPDGKVVFARDYINLAGQPLGHKVARLNTNGTLDASFVPALDRLPSSSAFTCMALQPDGKVVLGGYFMENDGFGNFYRRSLLIRLNTNGEIDDSFTSGSGSVGTYVSSLALQADGRLLTAGAIVTSVNGTDHYDVNRLNADGTIDNSFRFGADGIIHSVGLQPDGKILLAGYSVGSDTNRNGIARLNVDGSRDEGFTPGIDANSSLISFVVQGDGKVVCIGSYVYVGGTDRSGLVRLNSNGSLDESFTAATGAPNNAVATIALQQDGGVLIGGGFTLVNGTGRERLARLKSDGRLDDSFNPGSSINSDVNSLVIQSDGKVIIGGGFTMVGGARRNCVARLNANGTLDASFNPGTGAAGSYYGRAAAVSAEAVQSDGKVLVGGDFSSFNGISRNRLARLNPDGSLDTSFIPWIGAPLANYAFQPLCVSVEPDGKILVGGNAGLASNGDGTGLVRLNADGSFDTSFHADTLGTTTGNYAVINSLARQPDGKILAGGYVVQSDIPYYLLTRLNANGSRDPSFPAPGGSAGVTSIVLQLDGKFLVGGWYGNGGWIARYNTDGSVDNTFNASSDADGSVNSIRLQSEGKILIAGFFTSFHGTSRAHIVRLNANGDVDSSFTPGTGADGNSIALQSDGSVLVSGSFTGVNGVVRPRLARLYGDSPSAFAIWAASYGLTGASASATADPDSDGLINSLEFVLGGDPMVPTPPSSPLFSAVLTGDNLVLTFARVDASETAGISIGVETSTDLKNWNSYAAIGADTQNSGPGVIITENGGDPDLITVTIPAGFGPSKFARLKITFPSSW